MKWTRHVCVVRSTRFSRPDGHRVLRVAAEDRSIAEDTGDWDLNVGSVPEDSTHGDIVRRAW